jgi:N-acylneuraminate cytidylyltransferase
MNVLAVIPARGGSKSIPRKNIVQLAGKPLISHSIGTALESRQITRVIVSTDDPEIAEVARQEGAEVPFLRPPELATDTATDFVVFEHALAELERTEAYRADVVVQLRPTCPVRRSATVDRAVAEFLSMPDATSMRSVSPARQTPFKMWFLAEQGLMRPALNHPGIAEPYNAPRQSLPVAYWQNGYVDVTRPHTIQRLRSMTGPRIAAFVIEEPVFDIDYRRALAAAEAHLAGSTTTFDPDELPG